MVQYTEKNKNEYENASINCDDNLMDTNKYNDHDLFFSNEHCLKRLIEEYDNGNNIIIAYDFDDTIYGYYDKSDKHNQIIEIVKKVQDYKFDTILFTVREGEYLDFALSHLSELGINPTYVNENPNVVSRKPFFNLLLDDRCGLKQSYDCLCMFLAYVEEKMR